MWRRKVVKFEKKDEKIMKFKKMALNFENHLGKKSDYKIVLLEKTVKFEKVATKLVRNDKKSGNVNFLINFQKNALQKMFENILKSR